MDLSHNILVQRFISLLMHFLISHLVSPFLILSSKALLNDHNLSQELMERYESPSFFSPCLIEY